MNETKEKRSALARWFLLCPVRHVLTAMFGLLIALYFLLRSNRALLYWLSDNFVRPWHRAASRLCSYLPFSVAELLIVLAVLAGLVYIIFCIARIIRRDGKLKQAYKLVLTAAMAFCVIYGGFCTLWGIYFYTADFEEQSGIHSEPLSKEQLETVTRYFTLLVNAYSDDVSRDENGVFNEPTDSFFDCSAHLYDAVSESYSCLEGAALATKPFFFSEILSRITFTGFFFPFTAEANINTDSPACLIPSTIAHEIAHQRGVAEEDEANFVAVLACLEDGDPVFCYSACLLAYIHLGNALYRADYEAWKANYETLSPGVVADLRANNAYWDKYKDTVVEKASDAVYTGLLHSYGQEQGLQTYGACIDLLVAYYYDDAIKELG